MRVIAGAARSLPLKTLDGLETRPTTDRIKETLFNILAPDIPGCDFLDLFAGSGGIGIEALSRGAKSCTFVEHSRKAVACIKDNLAFTRLADRAVVCQSDVFDAIGRLTGRKPFHIIFMDPPYHKQLEQQVLAMLSDTSFLGADTLLVAESALSTDFSFAGALGLAVVREKRYKTNKHVFLRRI